MEPLHRFVRDWHSQVIARTARLHAYVLQRVNAAPAARMKTPAALTELIEEIEQLSALLYDRASKFCQFKDQIPEALWSTGSVVGRLAMELQNIHQKLQFVPAPWARPELNLFLSGVLDEKLPSYCSRPGLQSDSWTIVLSSTHDFANIGIGQSHPNGDLPRLQNVLTLPAAEESNVSVWPNLVHELGHMIERSSEIVRETKDSSAYQKYLADAKHLHANKTLAILGTWVEEIVADLIATDMLGPAYFLALSSFASHWYRFPLIKATHQHPSCDTRLRYILTRLRGTSLRNSEIVDQLKAKWDARIEIDAHMHTGIFHDRDLPDTNSLLPPEERIYEIVEQIVNSGSYSALMPNPPTFDGNVIWSLQQRIATGELIATRRKRHPEDLSKLVGKELHASLEEIPNEVTEIVTSAIFFQNSCRAVPNRLAHDEMQTDYEGEIIDRFCRANGSSPRRNLEEVSSFIAAYDASVSKSIEARAIAKFYEANPLTAAQ